jgi:hypothetical protein
MREEDFDIGDMVIWNPYISYNSLMAREFGFGPFEVIGFEIKPDGDLAVVIKTAKGDVPFLKKLFIGTKE